MRAFSTLKTLYTNAVARLMLFVASFYAAPAMALDKIDLTQNGAGNTNFTTIAENIDDAAQTGAALLIQLVAIGGFVVVAFSLYQLYKASKDEREKPTSAIVGLFIGGAMAAVSTIMYMMRNTIVG